MGTGNKQLFFYALEVVFQSLLGVYVDDTVLAARSLRDMKGIKRSLSDGFVMQDLGELHYFLGIQIAQNPIDRTSWVGQSVLVQRLLETFGMNNCKNTSTSVNSGTKLTKTNDSDERVDCRLYQSLIGRLLYLSIATRPDISFAVSSLAKYCSNLSVQHWIAAKHLLPYLKGTVTVGLLFSNDKSHQPLITGNSDADWAGDVWSRFLCGWQPLVTFSSWMVPQ